ncbi:MAG TPA: ELWxxDGT repeat protein [Archangium sp.]|uniref:ELWxxDGT repeat protein n=1 Tax=Archangium sp. TaxID=1872627 RepID=UPI002E371E17|nr:ELWxxDGT repeat protein [Archangium sp.]HEX5753913.1 ELWxxDGT repeat protein [Archangium sp.]
MHLKARHPLRPLSPLLLSFALGCTGPAPEQEASLLSSAFKQSPPPGLRPALVKDLQVSDESLPAGADTSWAFTPPVVTASGTAYFGARDGNGGSALFKTDGTPEGTRLVRQFTSRTAIGFLHEWLAAVGDTVYFAVNDERLGNRLFKSDGTPEGTLELPRPEGLPLDRPGELTACNGRIFFRDPQGLWTLEGTPERPVLLASVNIYPQTAYEQPPRAVVCAEGTLFFVDARAFMDNVLWKSDGTAEGTVPLASVGHITGWSNPLFFTSGARVFLNGGYNWRTSLWTSDGTPEGTGELSGFNPYESSLTVHTAAGGALYFSLPGAAYDPDSYALPDTFTWGPSLALWKSDSTGTGSHEVVDLPSDIQSLSASALAVGNTLLLSTTDGRLYRSDGTSEGTFLLANLGLPEASEQRTSAALPDGRLLFTAREPSGETRLWLTDGTVEGTLPFQTAQGERLRTPSNLTRMGNRVLFWADDGLHGQEPWVTDGTPGGTRLLRDLFRANASHPQSLTDVEGTLFCTATSEQGSGLWKSDGTAEGTTFLQPLISTDPWVRTTAFTPAGNSVFFFQTNHFAASLWKSDGTPAGTLELRGFTGGDVTSRVALGSTLFFSAYESASGSELWKSDGTVEGTVLFKELVPGRSGSGPMKLTRAGNGFFFIANDGVHGGELWKSDGTTEGTVLVKDVLPGTGSAIYSYGFSEMLPVGTALFFTANDGIHGEELWKTDGTAEGTVLVKDIFPGRSGSSLYDLVDLGGTLFFTAEDGVHGRELWKSDGTAEGTVLVADVAPGAASSFPVTYAYQKLPARLYAIGGGLFFAADDGVHGTEPWKSDGTAEGTVLLRDVLPGSESSGVGLAPFVPMGHQGAFAFSASDGVSGVELWTSDGTPEGTHRLADIHEGPASAAPLQLTASGSRLFFVANDGEHGRELWSVKQGAFLAWP